MPDLQLVCCPMPEQLFSPGPRNGEQLVLPALPAWY
jgi:hypothetical protein